MWWWKGLPRALWKLLSRRNKRSRIGRSGLIEVRHAHGTWRMEVWPHGSFTLEHCLLPLLVKTRPLLVKRHGILARQRVVVIHEWRGVLLFKHMLSWEPWLSNKERLPLLRLRGSSPGFRGMVPLGLIKVSRDRRLEFWGTWKSLGNHSRPGLVWHRHQGHLRRRGNRASEVRVDMNVLGLLWRMCR